MTKALPLALVALGLLPPSAQAVDWKVKSRLSQTTEVNDNRRMAPDPAGESYLSVSTLLFDATALTKTSSFNFNGNLGYRAYAGPGEPGTEPSLDKGVGAKFQKTEKLTTYSTMASWRETETAAIQLAENGVATAAGSTTTTTFEAGLRHALSQRDTVSLTATRTVTTSTGSGNTNLTAGAIWNRKVSPLTTFSPSLRFQLLDYDDAAQTQVTFVTANMGAQSQLTKLVSVKGQVGAAWLNAESRAGGAATGASATNPANLPGGSDVDWLANIQITYKLRTVVVSLTAARGVGPNTFGEFVGSETLGMSLLHRINDESNVSAVGTFSHQTSLTGGATDSYTAVLAYSRTLARDWQSQISYRFQQRDSSATGGAISGDVAGQSVRSNSVHLSVSRNVTILP